MTIYNVYYTYGNYSNETEEYDIGMRNMIADYNADNSNQDNCDGNENFLENSNFIEESQFSQNISTTIGNNRSQPHSNIIITIQDNNCEDDNEFASGYEDDDDPNNGENESNASDDIIFEQSEEHSRVIETQTNERNSNDFGLNKKYKNKISRKNSEIPIEVGNMIVCATGI